MDHKKAEIVLDPTGTTVPKLGTPTAALSPKASFPYCSEWYLRFAKALSKASQT